MSDVKSILIKLCHWMKHIEIKINHLGDKDTDAFLISSNLISTSYNDMTWTVQWCCNCTLKEIPGIIFKVAQKKANPMGKVGLACSKMDTCSLVETTSTWVNSPSLPRRNILPSLPCWKCGAKKWCKLVWQVWYIHANVGRQRNRIAFCFY